jgi:pSer/pThr/pTyr-binding forkhead associated (FHA) protein
MLTIALAFFTLFLFMLVLIFSPVLAVLFLLLLLLALVLLNRLRPEYFAHLRHQKAEEKVPISRAKFEALLQDVFTPDIILVSTSNSVVISITINKSHYVLGRSAVCDYAFLQDRSISKEHCCIDFDPASKQYFIRDMGSRNGTFLNSRRIPVNTSVPFQLHDLISIHSYQFLVKSASY